MRVTNKFNIPEPIVEAVRNDSYSSGDSKMGVTTLIGPARKAAIDREHEDELTEDASDRIWSLLGQSIHTILERANVTGIAERRMSIMVEGWKISGGMDLVCKDRILSDYKTVTAYKFKGGAAPLEYEQQLNCYAEILRQNGEEVASLQIVGILRDWSKLEARRDANYPQSQVIVVQVPLWTSEQAQKFIRERVILHQQARVKLPECTPEERWARASKFALMKNGQKKAVKLYDNEADAKAHASTSPALYVQTRVGESIRCTAYCSASKWCTQFQATKPVQAEDESEAV